MRHTTKPLDLAAAISAAAAAHQGHELTFAELVCAFSAATLDETDLRLRKWLPAFGHLSAWTITSEQLEAAAQAMREHGYAGATVNRDVSSIGSLTGGPSSGA